MPASPSRAPTGGRRAARGPGRADQRRRRRLVGQRQSALHLLELHRRVGQPAGPRGRALGGGAARPRLQPALPLRRRGPGQDPPDARDRQRGGGPLPAQARRLRDQREVHERVHHEHPAGPDRRLPVALPANRPAPDRRHPVHRRQGADPGGVLPHVQRDPRGRQADRALVGSPAEADHHARGAAAEPVRVGPDRGPHRARTSRRGSPSCGPRPRIRRSRSARTSSSSSRARSSATSASSRAR